jgi:uncharacterized membrane protein YphA (DoxX/SURF4 family)
MNQTAATKTVLATASPQASLAFVKASLTGAHLLTAGRTALAASTLGLGALGLIVGDFALQWQPVPETMPARAALAYWTALLLATLGAALLIARFRTVSALCVSATFFLWALVLQGPKIPAAPLEIGAWLGFGEILSIASGALMLAAAHSAVPAFSRWAGLGGRLLFGACLPVFGLSHFAYIDFTASMIPAWIPAHVFFAWFTGACHVAAGLSILSGILARLSSLMFALMVSGFVLLLHVPRVVGDPTSRLEWTMLVMASTITAAAWCAAGSIASHPARSSGRAATED